MADQSLTLSLFLMLLSFFIILNSVSEFEINKAQSVLSSVSLSFSKQTKVDEISSTMDLSDIGFKNKGTALDQIQALFTAQISGVEASKNRFGTEMQMRLPVKEFEKLLGKAAIRNPQGLANNDRDLLPMMVSLMDIENTLPYRIDILLHTSENPAKMQNDAPNQLWFKAKTASRYSEKIEQIGLSRRLVTSGLKQGEDGMVDLVFRRYIPFDPSSQKDIKPQEQP